MKKLLIISMVSVMGFASSAMAQDFEQYVSGKGVWSYGTYKANSHEDSESFKESKSVAGIRLAYGLIFPMGENALRAELEYGLNGNQKMNKSFVDDGETIHLKNSMKSQSLMANVYYDFNTGTNFTPYVGAGIGYARLKNSVGYTDAEESFSMSKSKGNFAWNASVGTTYKIDKNLALDVSYRFTDYGKVKFNPSETAVKSTAKLRSNELNFGVRYTF